MYMPWIYEWSDENQEQQEQWMTNSEPETAAETLFFWSTSTNWSGFMKMCFCCASISSWTARPEWPHQHSQVSPADFSTS